MGRYSYSNKTEADYLTKLTVSFLNKHSYFNAGYHWGAVTWTKNGMGGESKSSISVSSEIGDNEKKLHISYTITKQDGEQKYIDYYVSLETTPCHYGGVRFWFICPLYRNGKYCGRRVGTLYQGGDYFGCRHCYDLTYESKKENRRYKLFALFNTLLLRKKIDDIEQTMKRPYYAGKPTRKQRRINGVYRKAGMSYLLYERLEKQKMV